MKMSRMLRICCKLRCRAWDSHRKQKLIIGTLLIMATVVLLSQMETERDDIGWGNHDLLLALGRQGSARDVHGHRFKYLGIDGKWIPVSDDTPAAVMAVNDLGKNLGIDDGVSSTPTAGNDILNVNDDHGGDDRRKSMKGNLSNSNGQKVVDRQGYKLANPSRKDSSRGQSMVIDKLLKQLVSA